MTVCNGANAENWVNPEDDSLAYTFSCMEMDGASKLTLGAAVIVASYMLA